MPVNFAGLGRKTGGAHLAQGGVIDTDAMRVLGNKRDTFQDEPTRQPHELSGLADLLKQAAMPDQGTAAEKYANVPNLMGGQPLPQPHQVMPSGGTTLPQPTGAQPPPNPGLNLDLQALPNQERGEMGGPSPVKANVRPRFIDTGDPVGDQQRYYDQTQAYTPENHNSRLKSFGMTLLRGIADAAAASGNDLNAIIGGGIAGGIAGAVDPAQDEYYHNERVAKPKALEGLGTAIKTKKALTDIAADEALTQDRLDKPVRDAAKERAKAAQQTYLRMLSSGRGFDPDDPANADLVATLKESGYPVAKVAAGETARQVQDAITGEWFTIYTSKDGKTRSEKTGLNTTSEGKANRTAAELRQERLFRQQEKLQNDRQEFQERMKGIPQATNKSAGGGSDSDGKPYAGRTINLEKIVKQAEATIERHADETDEKYEERIDREIERLKRAAYKAGAVPPPKLDGRITTPTFEGAAQAQ
jgi:hypothetical protein